MRHFGERVVCRLELRPVEHRAVAVDSRPVTACDRSGQLEAVLDRAQHQRHERLRRCTCFLEEVGGRAVEGDQEVRRDRGARVVARPSLIGELEGTQSERFREPRRTRLGVTGLGRDRRPRTVELLGPARERQRLQRVDGKPSHVWIERRERGTSRDVRDPGARLDRARHLGNRAVGHAEQPQLPVRAHGHAALAQAGGDRGAGASGTDHGDVVEHGGAPAPSRMPGVDSVPARVRVEFTYEGDARSVKVRGSVESLGGTEMRKQGGRWIASVEVPDDVRAAYWFALDGEEDWTQWLPDPSNAKRYVYPAGLSFTGEHEVVASLLEGPEAPPFRWSAERDVPRRSVELRELDGRRVWVYLPARGQPEALLVLSDGLEYTTLAPAPTVLDNLIDAGEIPPTAALLPDSVDT